MMYRNSGVVISIMGPDGAGKSTLAISLQKELSKEGKDVEVVHSYQWYKNMFAIPFKTRQWRSQNRYIILDRCILDNGVEIARKVKIPKLLRYPFFAVLSIWTARYDIRIFIHAPLETLLSRRNDENPARIEGNFRLYKEIFERFGYMSIESTETALSNALKIIRER